MGREARVRWADIGPVMLPIPATHSKALGGTAPGCTLFVYFRWSIREAGSSLAVLILGSPRSHHGRESHVSVLGKVRCPLCKNYRRTCGKVRFGCFQAGFQINGQFYVPNSR